MFRTYLQLAGDQSIEFGRHARMVPRQVGHGVSPRHDVARRAVAPDLERFGERRTNTRITPDLERVGTSFCMRRRVVMRYGGRLVRREEERCRERLSDC